MTRAADLPPGMTTAELTELAARIDAELTRRALAEQPARTGRDVVEEKPAPQGHYRRELVNCGKERCGKCAGGRPSHGPYWYHYARRNGRLTSRYIGKILPGADPGQDPLPDTD